MTDTILTPQSTDTSFRADIPLHPADILMNLIVAFLAPMFLCASAGNIEFARLAAIETVNAYRGRSNADLVSIAQVIGFGFAALGSLSLSMEDNLSMTTTLRLRGNAVALNRAAEQNRRALGKSHTRHPAAQQEQSSRQDPVPTGPAYGMEIFDETALAASIAAAQSLAAETSGRLQAAHEPTPKPVVTPAQPASAIQHQNQLIWATTMANEASMVNAGIARLPPAERKEASFRASVLSSTANALLAGMNAASLPGHPADRSSAPYAAGGPTA